MQNCCSPTCCGLISPRRICKRHWPNSSGGSVAMADADRIRRSDLPVRAASAVVMAAIAGGAVWLGGATWTVFVVTVALGVLWEWVGLVRGFVTSPARRGLWNAAGFGYVGLAASMLVILRGSQPGLGALLMIVAGVIATDIGAYFTGRTFGGPKIAPR